MLPVAVLAGGLATRLRPITTTIPKSLVRVAGRHFIDHQLEALARHGVTRACLLVGHLGEQIEAHLGKGAFGIALEYSYDGDTLLGTGGAIKRALPRLGAEFFVLYGDSYLDIDYGAVERAFRDSGAPALMTVYRNENRWDKSNVVFEDGRIVHYSKKMDVPGMAYIDYGLGVLRADTIARYADDVRFDLSEVYADLASRGMLAGYEAQRRFFEIGSPVGLAELEGLLGGPRAAADGDTAAQSQATVQKRKHKTEEP